MPGVKYFETARKLGYPIPKNPDDERTFWEGQIHALGLDPTNLRLV